VRRHAAQPLSDGRLEFLNYLKASAFSEWLSVSMAGFPTFIALHSVGMAVVVGLSLMITLRLHEVALDFRLQLIPRLLTIAAWGFVLNLVTGLALFITRGPEYITAAIFLLKMSFVVIGAILMFQLSGRLRPLNLNADAFVVDRTTRVMSLIATASWFAAVVAGRMIAYLSSLYR
jgi:hypothetical protein